MQLKKTKKSKAVSPTELNIALHTASVSPFIRALPYQVLLVMSINHKAERLA